MIKITNITSAKQEQAVLEVQENQVTHHHVVSMHFIYTHHLEIGQELPTAFYRQLVQENEYDQLYNKALHFISYQMRTISEVKKHLGKSTSDESVIQTIVDRLKKDHYINDATYVKEYVSEKLEYDIIGPIKIKEKLIQKGIHYDLIDSELQRYTETLEYAKMEDFIRKDIRYTIKKPYRKYIESLKRKAINRGFHLHVIDSAIVSFKDDILEQIDDRELLQKEYCFLRKTHDIDHYDDRQKLIQKLLRKGFNYDRIKELLEEESPC
ncbi:RecX family transcriptional regulator [Candidatus Xianfuyuplasma coldseepsis]|uniref:Regulatory protein RecX n=1 Tax=Candidatus Xianfuyuplasma coldseepsis TaxID=2782163 RepID=A0A7L7KNJ1_9MOLU|nr:RecX family transcriptional regulator [Xianfuyuplasma coldseepsis]QMS84301.1 hypothetical protein G4Z02_00610 [Xianfuyuplasma coldseepsis]